MGGVAYINNQACGTKSTLPPKANKANMSEQQDLEQLQEQQPQTARKSNAKQRIVVVVGVVLTVFAALLGILLFTNISNSGGDPNSAVQVNLSLPKDSDHISFGDHIPNRVQTLYHRARDTVSAWSMVRKVVTVALSLGLLFVIIGIIAMVVHFATTEKRQDPVELVEDPKTPEQDLVEESEEGDVVGVITLVGIVVGLMVLVIGGAMLVNRLRSHDSATKGTDGAHKSPSSEKVSAEQPPETGEHVEAAELHDPENPSTATADGTPDHSPDPSKVDPGAPEEAKTLADDPPELKTTSSPPPSTEIDDAPSGGGGGPPPTGSAGKDGEGGKGGKPADGKGTHSTFTSGSPKKTIATGDGGGKLVTPTVEEVEDEKVTSFTKLAKVFTEKMQDTSTPYGYNDLAIDLTYKDKRNRFVVFNKQCTLLDICKNINFAFRTEGGPALIFIPIHDKKWNDQLNDVKPFSFKLMTIDKLRTIKHVDNAVNWLKKVMKGEKLPAFFVRNARFSENNAGWGKEYMIEA